jgi:hypothetical protein
MDPRRALSVARRNQDIANTDARAGLDRLYTAGPSNVGRSHDRQTSSRVDLGGTFSCCWSSRRSAQRLKGRSDRQPAMHGAVDPAGQAVARATKRGRRPAGDQWVSRSCIDAATTVRRYRGFQRGITTTDGARSSPPPVLSSTQPASSSSRATRCDGVGRRRVMPVPPTAASSISEQRVDQRETAWRPAVVA